jgi:uncharacterized membrane protein YciS (DUF1049 family)
MRRTRTALAAGALAYVFAAGALAQGTGGAAPGAGDGMGILDKLLSPGNLAASTLLALNVVGFIKGWIVPAWVYAAEKARADRMEERAWKATEAMGKSIETVSSVARAVLPPDKGAAQ